MQSHKIPHTTPFLRPTLEALVHTVCGIVRLSLARLDRPFCSGFQFFFRFRFNSDSLCSKASPPPVPLLPSKHPRTPSSEYLPPFYSRSRLFLVTVSLLLLRTLAYSVYFYTGASAPPTYRDQPGAFLPPTTTNSPLTGQLVDYSCCRLHVSIVFSTHSARKRGFQQ